MTANVKLNGNVIASFLINSEDEINALYNTLTNLDIAYDEVELKQN